MTNEQAIKYLQESKCDGTINYTHQEMHNTALDLAIQALEKQIPMSPIQEEPTNEARDNSEAYCPTCECYLEEDYRICPECGQKLDWGDTE